MAAAAAYCCFLLCFITAICFKCYTGYWCPADSDSGSLGCWYPTTVSLLTHNFSSLASHFFTSSRSQRYVLISNYSSAFLGLLFLLFTQISTEPAQILCILSDSVRVSSCAFMVALCVWFIRRFNLCSHAPSPTFCLPALFLSSSEVPVQPVFFSSGFSSFGFHPLYPFL
ncbi:hypothetical protein C8J56DRAFT_105015 [Mycena floridula]|nr:hypothetical protein C8J56DRAFT_105015 [Mycena floridula]